MIERRRQEVSAVPRFNEISLEFEVRDNLVTDKLILQKSATLLAVSTFLWNARLVGGSGGNCAR